MVRDLMSDAEWAFFAPFVIETGPKRGRPPRNHRRVLDGVFWIARTGSPWRDLPESFGPWASVYGKRDAAPLLPLMIRPVHPACA